MSDNKFDILMKSWEMYQNLAKGFGDSSWKIKSIGIGFWATIIGFAYKESDVLPVYFSILVLMVFFLLETGLKRLQYKYIYKSLEIESAINDILVGDVPRLPDDGISTNIDTPNIGDFFELFRLKRWMFWAPYLTLLGVTILFIVFAGAINI